MIYKTAICATWVYIRYNSEKQYKILFLRCICVLMDCSILHMQFIEDVEKIKKLAECSILHMQFIEKGGDLIFDTRCSILHMQFIEDVEKIKKLAECSILHMQFIERHKTKRT